MEIKIDTEFITLVQLFKLTNLVSSGGEFSIILKNKEIVVNDTVAFEKRKKIYPGDVVRYKDLKISVVYENK